MIEKLKNHLDSILSQVVDPTSNQIRSRHLAQLLH